MAWEAVPLRMKYRVVNRVTMAEVIHDLAHISSSWRVNAMQPGLSGASAIGTFTITLPPVLSDEYERNAIDYGKLDYFLRVEGYVEVIAGRPKVAGFITGIHRTATSIVLTGVSDIWLALRQRTFPNELHQGSSGVSASYSMWLETLGVNEVSYSDDFTGATPLSNYTSTNVPGLTSGTWTTTTDDGVAAVTCSTGTGATLLSTATTTLDANDFNGAALLEMTGRFAMTGANATNAGELGLVFGADASNCTLVKMRLRGNGATPWAPYTVDVTCQRWAAGVSVAGPTTVTAALSAVGDTRATTWLDVQLQVHLKFLGPCAWVTVNGQPVNGGSITFPNGFDSMGPASFTNVKFGPYFGVPSTATAQLYVTNLYLFTRFSYGAAARASTFTGSSIPGDAATSKYALPGTTYGPTFLDMWQRATEMEGYQWRYTPQALKAGARTLGDFIVSSSPGTDVSGRVRFLGGANLLDVIESPPAAGIGTSVQLSGLANDSGGQIIARNKSALTTYGVIDDNQLNLTTQEYRSLRKNAQSLNSNQAAPASAITLVVLRDPQTADQWRELDTVYAHWPERGILNQTYKVYSYTMEEGSPVQQIQCGQYGAQQSADRARRNFYALQQIGNTFKAR